MQDPEPILLVYDRQCPACDLYCRLTEIDESEGALVRVDARGPGAVMDEITARGLDIDEGMVLKVGDDLYYGHEAIHQLALRTKNAGLFNRLARFLFRSPRAAKWLYPPLKGCRNLLLKLLGRTRINNLGVPGKDRF